MKPLSARSILSEAVIVAGVSAALGMVVLSRLESESRDVERDLLNASLRLAERAELEASQPQWLEMRRLARAANASVAEFSGATADAAALHDRLMVLARDCDIRVDRIQPSQRTMTPEPAASDDPSAPPPVRALAAIANSIDVSGRYDSLVRFIERLEDLGFSRVNEVRIVPRREGDERLVQASLQTVHFAFAQAGTQDVGARVEGSTP